MTKSELVEKIHAATGMSRSAAMKMLNAMTKIVTQQVAEGQCVQISGFGQFQAKAWPARAGKDPRTREPVWLPETKVPAFKPSAQFKSAVRLGYAAVGDGDG